MVDDDDVCGDEDGEDSLFLCVENLLCASTAR